jgi:hypothetical protein
MTRLIAQELAARERELVQLKPEDIKKAQQWIGTNTANNTNTNPIKKTVSFSTTAAAAAQEEGEDPEFEETESIFSKFKKIHTAVTLEDVHNKLVELEQGMIARHAELMAKCFCNCDTGAV